MALLQYGFYPTLTPVRVASSANLAGTYSNGPNNNGVGASLLGAASTLTLDSVVMANGDRVLLYGQTSALQNGIYFLSGIGSAWLLTRSDDFHNVENMKAGLQVSVGAGTVLGGSMFVLIEPLPAAFGVSDILFESVATPGSGSATFSDVTITSTITMPNGGLHLLDTNASHDLVISPGSDLTADRILTITTGDAARTLTLSGNATLDDWFDQSVKAASSPAFANPTISGTITLPNGGLHLLDTNASHDLVISPGSDLTADRILTITTGDAARTLDISAASVTISTFGGTLVDDATKLLALDTLGVKRGTTASYGGGGTSNAFVATGIVATDIVVASLLSAANNVSLTKVVPTANTLTVDFSADPGAGTTVSWHAIATV